jgi:DNA-directed RNA polymerase subunit RPC12/RpoP
MKEKTVKGRKEYTCVKCGKMIEKGEEHIVRNKLREHIKCSISDVYYVIGFFIATLIFLGTVMK